jgi:hypothetical protein
MKIMSILFATLFMVALGTTAAQAAPESAPANHGNCVSGTENPDGPGGRSEIAKDKSECPAPVSCTTIGLVDLDSANNEVTVTGTGPGTAGSALQCETSIDVTAGDTASFTYELGEGTDPCGGGVPRLYFLIDGIYYNTIDGDPECSEAAGNTVTYTFPVTGTVTEVGFVYDRGDNGSVTYSDATVGDVEINI